MRRVLAALLIGLPLLGAPIAPAAAATGMPPIEHLVVIVEQNATFDHTFGTLPDVNGIEVGQKLTMAGGDTVHIKGFSKLGPHAFIVPQGEEVLSNGPTAASDAFRRGHMDGFWDAQIATGKNPHLPFTVIDEPTLSPWAQLARRGVVFDNYYSSYLAGSLPNTLSLVSGSAHGRERGSSANVTSLWNSRFPTVFDEATAAGVSWRYYVGGLDGIDEKKVASRAYVRSADATPSALYWAPILSMKRFWTDPALAANVKPQGSFFSDVASGDLPNITYILPQPTTHEPLVLGPDLRLLSILNAIRTAPTWKNTAVMVVWDDWGGYYDHVTPERAGGEQLGFRVPALLLSPWVEQGVVSHQELDHSSIPALATSLFGLRPIAARTSEPADVWLDAPRTGAPIEALDYAPPYVAAGMANARTVYLLYALTAIVIVVVLGVLGVSLWLRPGRGEAER